MNLSEITCEYGEVFAITECRFHWYAHHFCGVNAGGNIANLNEMALFVGNLPWN